jgi:hypothetical protein
LRNQEDLNEGQPSIQDNQGVESRDLQCKSEGQLRIPTSTVRVVESLPEFITELVHARGDDPLAKQGTLSHRNCTEPDPESNLAPGGVIDLNPSSLHSPPNDDVQITKSQKFVG